MYRSAQVGMAQRGGWSLPQAISDRVRSKGEIDMSFAAVAGSTRLSRGFQSGCLRLRVPRRMESQRPCAVLINTSGGLAEGDAVRQRLRWEAGTHGVVTTQAAEKVYRALTRRCTIETHIDVAAGAEAEWLPQETIVFDQANLNRETHVSLNTDSSFLGVEAIVLGRTAMNERMRTGALRDTIRVKRDGKLIYADALALDGAIEPLIQRRAIAGGGCAMAVILYVAAKAETLIQTLREAFSEVGGLVAASCWNGMLVVRMVAAEGATLRRNLIKALTLLRDGRPLPRVWNC